MAYPSRNSSTYTLTGLHTGYLLYEDYGKVLIDTDGNAILLGESGVTQDTVLSSRNISSYSLPSRN